MPDDTSSSTGRPRSTPPTEGPAGECGVAQLVHTTQLSLTAVAYVRADNARKADAQRAAIAEHCETHGLDLVAISDDLTEALCLLSDPGAGTLVVAKLDRLAPDVAGQEVALHEARRHGRRVVSVAGESDVLGDTPSRDRAMAREVLAAADRQRSAIHAARSKRGLARVAQNGRLVRRPRYGELPGEEAIPGRIAELRAQGKSLAEIGVQLLADGHRPREGAVWHDSTISRIAKRVEVGGDA